MRHQSSRFWVFHALLLPLVAGISCGQSPKPSADATNAIRPPFDYEKLQAETARAREGIGPWKQVAAIASFHQVGFVAANPTNSRPSNINIISFLDNERLFVADGTNQFRIFNSSSGALLKTFGHPLPSGWPNRKAVSSPDGGLIMVIPDPEPKIWNTRSGEIITKFPEFGDHYVLAVFFSDGRRIATYRGLRSRGSTNDNLQVWELNEKERRVTLLRSVTADSDVRDLHVIDQYLVLQGHRHSQVVRSDDLSVLLQQSTVDTDELFLFLKPPSAEQPSLQYGALELRPFGQQWQTKWRQTKPHFRLLVLPENKELRRWPCPIEEDGQNLHRYQAHFAVSPGQKHFSITQSGRLRFYRFESGEEISAVPGIGPYDRALVAFINNDLALVCRGRPPSEDIVMFHIPTGQVVARIPDHESFPPAMSPDKRRLAIRRNMAPRPSYQNPTSYMELRRPLVILWRQTGEYDFSKK